MNDEQYFKEAMNKLTEQEDKEELELCWLEYKDRGTYTPIEYKNGTYCWSGSGYICWEFQQWVEATCTNGRICNTLGLTDKHLFKIQLLCRLRNLHLSPEEDKKWRDFIIQDNADVSKIDLALKNIQANERKQALAEDFKQV